MFNGENELDSLISSGSDYRSKFNYNPAGETLQSMVSMYIKNIPEYKRSQYDNEELILKTIQKYGFNTEYFDGEKWIDIIDFLRYFSWYESRGVTIEQISMLIETTDISDEVRVEVRERVFTWNKRKSELTKFERGFDFYDAVKVLTSAAHEVVKGEGNILYAFQKYSGYEKYYFVVELKKLEEERILSFRLTSDEEYKKIKEKYNVQK